MEWGVLEPCVRLGSLDGQSLASWFRLPPGLDREGNPYPSHLFVVAIVDLPDLFSASDEVVLLRADDQEVIGIEEDVLEIARRTRQLELKRVGAINVFRAEIDQREAFLFPADQRSLEIGPLSEVLRVIRGAVLRLFAPRKRLHLPSFFAVVSGYSSQALERSF